MAKKKLPKGIRKKGNAYEGRASIRGEMVYAYDKDLDTCIEKLEKAKESARANREKRYNSFTLNEWFEEWFELVKKHSLKETSYYPVKHNFKKTFGFYLGSKKIRDITAMDVQYALNAMKEGGMSDKAMREGLGKTRTCLDFAIANGVITKNPTLAIELPWSFKISDEIVALTQEEQNIFLNAAEGRWYEEMFYCMFLSGMRVGEVGGLKWMDVDFHKKEINIKRALSCNYKDGVKSEKMVPPKTANSVRKIPFMGEKEEMLLRQKEKQKKAMKSLGSRWRAKGELTNLVFTTSMGSTCTRYIVEKEVKKVLKQIREEEAYACVRENREPIVFPEIYPHAIRHTFATRCFERGMTPKVVQKLMGHSSISITLDIYTHVLTGRFMEETKKFGRANRSRGAADESGAPEGICLPLSEEQLYGYGLEPAYTGIETGQSDNAAVNDTVGDDEDSVMLPMSNYELLTNVLRFDEMYASKRISASYLTDIKEFFGVQRGQASRILNQWYFMLDDGCLPGEIYISLSLDELHEVLPILQKQMETEQKIIEQGNLGARIDAEFNLAVMKTIEEKIQLRQGSVFSEEYSGEGADELTSDLLLDDVG